MTAAIEERGKTLCTKDFRTVELNRHLKFEDIVEIIIIFVLADRKTATVSKEYIVMIRNASISILVKIQTKSRISCC